MSAHGTYGRPAADIDAARHQHYVGDYSGQESCTCGADWAAVEAVCAEAAAVEAGVRTMMRAEQHAMTLRMDRPPWDRLRREAFEREVSVTAFIREAVDAHLARVSTSGCDVCGKRATHVTTPGGMRGCDDHLRADARRCGR